MIRILGTALFASLLTPDASPLPQATQWLMGTHLRVVLADDGLPEATADSLLQECFAEVRRWEQLLSNYDPNTPLSRINQAAGSWVEVPVELHDYLARAQGDAARTDGTFDLTVGATHRDPTLRSGIQHLHLDTDPPRARLAADMALDPGGDGKGVALDAAVALLRKRGVRNALLEFGGSSWFGLGRPPEGEAWTVAVSDPDGRVVGRVRLVDQALSTSSAWRADAASPDAQETHIVDPVTRQAVTTRRVVAVISPSATDAEVLSTALVVGGQEGLRWLTAFPDADAVVLEDGVPTPGSNRWWTAQR